MHFAEFLTSQEVEQVHEGSLEILAEVGIHVHFDKARDVFAKHGCAVDTETGIVKISRNVVQEFRRAFVPEFTFRGRDPKFDRKLPDDRPVIITASSAPYVVDPETGVERPAVSKDIADIAHLINELPAFDVFSVSVLADDAPKGQLGLSRFYPALKNCLKPVRGNTPDMKELKDVLEMGAMIAGGIEAYAERPLITLHGCPMVSPLTMDINSTEMMMYMFEKGYPAYATYVPNAGLTAPMSIAGGLAVGNAEFLAFSVLTQMVRPQTPMIYAVLSTVADIRTGAYAPGAIETGILQMAHSQMARFYNVPSGGYIGMTNAHVNDAQSGYETGMSTTSAMLGGADMFNMGGLLGGLMSFDFAKAVIDNEIACMLKRIRQGAEVNAENLNLDVIAEIGPGGNYMDHIDTLNRMRTTAFLPKLANRDMRSTWEESGAPDIQSTALAAARTILTRDNPAVFSEALDTEIRARFTDLPAGDAGWK